jgi:peptide-methionine (R)-S-oxide reductase
MTRRIAKTDAEWGTELTPVQYRILRERGTEAAFTGAYWDHTDGGVYRCAACETPLFESEAKYDAGCGWPSFTTPASDSSVEEREDRSHGMVRTEVVCSTCGGHLGHVFPDGPGPDGQRYCINSASLDFEATEATPPEE